MYCTEPEPGSQRGKQRQIQVRATKQQTTLKDGANRIRVGANKRQNVGPKSFSRIAFGKRGDKARQNIVGGGLCGMDVAVNLQWSIVNLKQMIFYND